MTEKKNAAAQTLTTEAIGAQLDALGHNVERVSNVVEMLATKQASMAKDMQNQKSPTKDKDKDKVELVGFNWAMDKIKTGIRIVWDTCQKIAGLLVVVYAVYLGVTYLVALVSDSELEELQTATS